MNDGTIRLIEVKPHNMINDPDNLEKFAAIEKYCKEKNYIFEIFTEEELEMY